MRRGGGGGGGSKGGVGEAFQLTERLLLWTGREGILNIWLAGRWGGRVNFSGDVLPRNLFTVVSLIIVWSSSKSLLV